MEGQALLLCGNQFLVWGHPWFRRTGRRPQATVPRTGFHEEEGDRQPPHSCGVGWRAGRGSKVEPTLQQAPGVYNDTILAGLDYLLMQMKKRQMVAVLYLNNSWEWSGGYSFYLQHAGAGKAPQPDVDGYPAYMQFVSRFADNEKAHRLFYDYVRFILGRTNRYTGVKYVDDPAIMSWQIGNEPRAFSKERCLVFRSGFVSRPHSSGRSTATI